MKKTAHLLLFALCLTISLTTCKKDKAPTPPEIKIHNIEATAYSVHVDGVYIYEGELDNFYVVYGKQSDLADGEAVEMTIEDKKIRADIEGLEKNTTYYLSVEIRNKYSFMQSEVKSFKTENITKPEVNTKDVTEIGETTAICGGDVINDGGSEVTACGVCWSTSQNPTTSSSHTTDSIGTGSFTSNITNLAPNTKYYVRAYATNSEGTSYGEQREFTTLAIEGMPTVATNNITAVTTNSATSGGNISDDGNSSIIARGICWSTKPNPKTDDEHTEDGAGIGSFVSYMTGLTHNTTYYVRAYATNEKGTSYGDEKSFTTEVNEELPEVTTNNITAITINSATSGGNVTSDGNTTVTARGICWSTKPNPKTDDEHTEDGSGIGSFVSYMTGLTHNTTYYVRAYATNEKGTSYGEQKEFTTLKNIELPTVTTTDVTNITQTTATSGGNVTDDGGAMITARGVCWSTSQNPMISNSHTTDGTGAGSFTSDLIGLTANTKYYVRSYATNEKGTSYGEQKEFTTLKNIEFPTILTTNVTNITQTTATSGGFVTDDGGATITARGVCWSTTQNPTIDDNEGITTDGSGIGSFTSNIPNLAPNTQYYVRAYATNEKGTSYGEEKSFTTNDYGYVDLGLPSGLKWATCNVGASSPEDYGDYFAWGETSTKSTYTEENSLTDGLSMSELQTKGIIDSEGNLTSSHDAATANWGGSWRMPTKAEQQELIDECTWQWTTQGGKNGYKVTGPNGNSIFLPAAGYRYGSSLYYAGERGYFWSSTPDESDTGSAYYLYFTSGNHYVGWSNRYVGWSVRPVAE